MRSPKQTSRNNESSSSSSSSSLWTSIPATGHGVAVILVGSVMATLSANQIPACRHRVVDVVATDNNNNATTVVPTRRVAATLFGRPAPHALLQTPPCPRWSAIVNNNNNNIPKSPVTFEAWNARVARNYEKSKRNTNNNSNSNNKKNLSSA
uniref:Uncharacterized protein n=1 Tax=Amphora coffeiformis TaxID=265554 RepID=A0A7S3L0L5_9STRA